MAHRFGLSGFPGRAILRVDMGFYIGTLYIYIY